MVLEDLLGDEGDVDDLLPVDAGDRVEVDPQLVRMVEVLRLYRVGVEVDAAEVHDPREVGGVADHHLLGRAARRVVQLGDLDPVGPVAGARFWKNASSSMPLTKRLRIIGRPATPRRAPSATDR